MEPEKYEAWLEELAAPLPEPEYRGYGSGSGRMEAEKAAFARAMSAG